MNDVLHADVLIVGAGPAGATAALNLSPSWSVVLIERHPQVSLRIGESLPPSARRLLSDMGLLSLFDAEGHTRYYGNRVVWGGSDPFETHFVHGLDGHGWHLDRARFDSWMRLMAVDRGAKILTPASIVTIEPCGRNYRVLVSTVTGPKVVITKLLVDAAGRAAPVAQRLGARRSRQDALVCGWLCGTADPTFGAGLSYVEAEEDGWWYSAPQPGGRRILAFHTDADLPAAKILRNRTALLARAAVRGEISSILRAANFVPDDRPGLCAAHSATLTPCAGDSWLAVGDAALSFDPLSGQGLLNALYTGLAAAEVIDTYLAGASRLLAGYQEAIENISVAYRRRLDYCYSRETRWPHALFWSRRHSPLQRASLLLGSYSEPPRKSQHCQL